MSPSSAEGAAELSSGPCQVQSHNARPVLIYNSGACSLSVIAFLFLMGGDGPVKVLETFFFPQLFIFFGNNNVGWEARGAL